MAKFLIQADIRALRDGVCYILVDFPRRPANEDGSEMTYLQERQLNLRPFLTLYDAKQIVNLQSSAAGIELVTVREVTQEPLGRFGSETVERYRVLVPGGGELYRVVEQHGKEGLVLEDAWRSTVAGITLIPYSIGIGTEGFYGVQPPLLDLALLNLKHYQKSSEKDEIMHKCNIPILTLNRPSGLPKTTTTGVAATGVKSEPKVTIGPNTVLWNVQAAYVEPTGAALALTIQDLQNLENGMTQKTLDFLTLGDVTRTATEIVHTAAPLAASLAGMIVAKESAVRLIFDYWQLFSGGRHDATIQVDEGAIRSTINSTNIERLAALRLSRDISQVTYLTLLQEARVLPESLDLAKEMAMIAAELIPLMVDNSLPVIN